MRSLIGILDFTNEEIAELLNVGLDIIENPAKYSHKCDGKKLATLLKISSKTMLKDMSMPDGIAPENQFSIFCVIKLNCEKTCGKYSINPADDKIKR